MAEADQVFKTVRIKMPVLFHVFLNLAQSLGTPLFFPLNGIVLAFFIIFLSSFKMSGFQGNGSSIKILLFWM